MDKKFTIVKIMSAAAGTITLQDVERWRDIFNNHPEKVEKLAENGEITIEYISVPEDDRYITLVKIGNDDYKPSVDDLKAWQEIFQEAKNDPDFKIFTHPNVQIDVIKLGEIIDVE
jgi:hypothetical protein